MEQWDWNTEFKIKAADVPNVEAANINVMNAIFFIIPGFVNKVNEVTKN